MNKRIFTKHWLTLRKVKSSFLILMVILSCLKDEEMMRIKTKNPSLDQTGGPRDDESAGESAHAEEPMHTTKDLEEPSHQEFETRATKDQLVDETPQPSDYNLAREEVYKATTDQLDWNNPEGQQYPHDLRKTLPLIPNSRGRQVISFDHFINNDLAYLSGGVSSRTYATSVTKTQAHALWGISHWGRKRQQFYVFAANRESARDVYSKRRIIAVTKLQIVEWHSYKHLDWITIHRDDDKLYTFKEGDFKWLHLQDIEDMLILHVQGKLTNLNAEDRLAFGVSLRMFTRSMVIQRHVEDLQLGVESYQKKLNITKPDTYRSNLKRRDAYTAYSNPRGFIY
ncbi:hypothetical protein Tco_1528996 [Tanacetum coccineum]